MDEDQDNTGGYDEGEDGTSGSGPDIPNFGERISNAGQRRKDVPRKVKSGADKVRRAGQAIAKVIGAIGKALAAIYSNPISGIIFTVLVIVIIIVLLFVGAEQEETKKTAAVTSSYTSTLSDGNKFKETYKTMGSYLFATKADLEAIQKEYFGTLKDRDSALYKTYNRKFYNGDKGTTYLTNVANINDKKTIYLHILNSEKYNFNKIDWYSYKRSDLVANGVPTGALNMKVNSEYGLQYPDFEGDSSLTSDQKLDLYTGKVLGALQSYIIPLSMVTGTTKAGKSGRSAEEDLDMGSLANNSRFGYEIMLSGYHNIEFNRYELYTRTIKEDYRKYDEISRAGVVNRKCVDYTYAKDADGNYVHPDSGLAETKKTQKVCNDTVVYEPTTTKKEYIVYPSAGYSGELSSMYNIKSYLSENDDISGKTELTSSELRVSDLGNEESYIYDITKIKGFDVNVTKFYVFEGYKLSSYSKTSSETSVPYTKPTTVKTASGTNYVEKQDTKPAILDSIDEAYIKETVSNTSFNVTETAVENGKTVTMTRTWNDDLRLQNMASQVYEMQDIVNSAGVTSDSEFNSYEKNEYEQLEEKKEINRIDMLNSNPEIYSKYLRDEEEMSEHLGYTRAYLSIAYLLLKQNLVSLAKEYNITFYWGESVEPGITQINGGTALTDMETLLVSGAQIIYPFPSDIINSGDLYLQDNYVGNGSYGYDGHTGIDISYAYSGSYTDRSDARGSGYSDSRNPYIKGPPVYTVRAGTLMQITYSEWNKYHNTGTSGIDPDGSGPIQSGPATAVYIKQADGTIDIYYHLYPDKAFYITLSQKIGQSLPIGTLIGHMGNTGNSSGMHLHFESGKTMWAKNGQQTLAILNAGRTNTQNNNISTTSITQGVKLENTGVTTGSVSGTVAGSGEFTWYNLPTGLKPNEPPPASKVKETRMMKATVYGFFDDVGSACTNGTGSLSRNGTSYEYCKDQLGTASGMEPKFNEMAEQGKIPRVAAVKNSGGSPLIPYGTLIYIQSNVSGVPDYGYAVVADTGGGVGENQLDLYFPSTGGPGEAFNLGLDVKPFWKLNDGSNTIKVYILNVPKLNKKSYVYMMPK